MKSIIVVPPKEKTVINIVTHPNEILKTKCAKISKGDDAVIASLISMRKWVSENQERAIGLALPQIGIAKQGFVFYNVLTDKHEIAINPIIKKFAKYVPSNEGCLSIPGVHGIVSRAKEIHVMYFDTKLKPVLKILYGKTARIFQHEYDHLQGILFTDLPQLSDLEVDEEGEI